jgi:hypothetical protein
MTRIGKSIIIKRPVDEVFTYTSDWGKWYEGFEGVSNFKPTTYNNDARFLKLKETAD